MPFRKYESRLEYLKLAIPGGFHKKLLVFGGEVVGQIEYAPCGVSGYPIAGEEVIVMNCIWVLRKAKGHNFGKMLLGDMMQSEKNARGFSTIALENHWSPWLRKWQIEMLGFKSIDKIKVAHKTKHKGQAFNIHLMWMPREKDAEQPYWDVEKMLYGESFCLAHPLYNPKMWKDKVLELTLENHSSF
ncbi:MAG: hypothetical protein QW222_01440 [Candidatus Bathyarchaeia archaeon]